MESLTHDINTFVKSTKTFQKIMGSQSCVFDKVGLDFENLKIKRYMKTSFFLKRTTIKIVQIIRNKTIQKKNVSSKGDVATPKKLIILNPNFT